MAGNTTDTYERPVTSKKPFGPETTVAAGSASYTVLDSDKLINVSTSSGQATAIDVPNAADNIGRILTFTFGTDGGQDVTLNRVSSDVFNISGDTGNTSIVLNDAGDTVVLFAVSADIWLILTNVGATLS